MTSPPCPYLGIRPFERKDSHLFFGRTETITALLERLRTTHFVTVMAPSGYGKSSLVKAGLLPALEGGLLDGHTDWLLLDCRPGAQPFKSLADQLAAQIQDKAPATVFSSLSAGDWELRVQKSPHSLQEVVKHPHLSHFRWLLLIDQFEEIFRYTEVTGATEQKTSLQESKGDDQAGSQSPHDQTDSRSSDAERFVQLLLSSVPLTKEPPEELRKVYIVLTMRIEYLGNCARFRDLPEAINPGFFLVPRLTTEQLSEVIREPVKQYQGTVETQLHDALQSEMAQHPEQLPQLQHLLMRMWPDKTSTQQITLTMDSYTRKGEWQALSQHADELYQSLATLEINLEQPSDDPAAPSKTGVDARDLCARLFKLLTERKCENQYVRRPCHLSELRERTQGPETQIRAVVETFAAPGNDFLKINRSTDDWLIDIAHESLVSLWELLRKWADEEADAARIYQDLRQNCGEWLSASEGRKTDTLLQGQSLRQALLWREFGPTEAWSKRYGGDLLKVLQFIEASNTASAEMQQKIQAERAKQDRQNRETRENLARRADPPSSKGRFWKGWQWLRQKLSFKSTSSSHFRQKID